jgi:hypothetical protein
MATIVARVLAHNVVAFEAGLEPAVTMYSQPAFAIV